MNHNFKILEIANSCTILNDISVIDEKLCIKTLFLNALLNRWKSNYTLDDVASYLEVSKRTAINLEKCKVKNIVIITKYIKLFGKHNAEESQIKNTRRYFKGQMRKPSL